MGVQGPYNDDLIQKFKNYILYIQLADEKIVRILGRFKTVYCAYIVRILSVYVRILSRFNQKVSWPMRKLSVYYRALQNRIFTVYCPYIVRILSVYCPYIVVYCPDLIQKFQILIFGTFGLNLDIIRHYTDIIRTLYGHYTDIIR